MQRLCCNVQKEKTQGNIMPRTLTVEEAADYLKMCPRSIYNKVNAGELPKRKPGRRLIFYDYDLDNYLNDITQYNAPINNKIDEIVVETCQSTSQKTKQHPTITPALSSKEKRLIEVLGRRTTRKH